MKDQVDIFDEGSDLFSSDKVGLDKLAIRINVLLLSAEKIINAENLMALLD